MDNSMMGRESLSLRTLGVTKFSTTHSGDLPYRESLSKSSGRVLDIFHSRIATHIRDLNH